MEDIGKQSLEELEEHYKERKRYWTERMLDLLEEIDKCEQEEGTCVEQLDHVKALIHGPDSVDRPLKPLTPEQRARMPSLTRDYALKVLRNHPGEKLTLADIRFLIHDEEKSSCSRQAVNFNVGVLEDQGLVRREVAPKGSGARFVFQAVPGDPDKGLSILNPSAGRWPIPESREKGGPSEE